MRKLAYSWIVRNLREWLGVGEYPMSKQEFINLENTCDLMKDWKCEYEKEALKDLKENFPVGIKCSYETFLRGEMGCIVVGWEIDRFAPRVKVMVTEKKIFPTEDHEKSIRSYELTKLNKKHNK